MSLLCDRIFEQTKILQERSQLLEDFKNLSFKILKQLNYENELSYDSIDQVETFLSFADLLENEFFDSIFYTIRRICLYEKARLLLPRPLFQIEILQKIEDQDSKIKSLLNQYILNINEHDGIPKIHLYAEDDLWNEKSIDWGLVNLIMFPSNLSCNIIQLPIMIKSMIYHVVHKHKYHRMLSLHITSCVGWRFREKFYQPYQILELRATEQTEYQWFEDILDSINETDINNLNVRSYYVKSLVKVCTTAKQLLQHPFPDYYKTMVTDGRRLFITDLNSTYQVSRQQMNEARSFLENLRDKNHLDIPYDLLMEAEEMEAHSNIYGGNMSPDSPSLDSIEEANLVNRMED